MSCGTRLPSRKTRVYAEHGDDFIFGHNGRRRPRQIEEPADDGRVPVVRRGRGRDAMIRIRLDLVRLVTVQVALAAVLDRLKVRLPLQKGDRPMTFVKQIVRGQPCDAFVVILYAVQLDAWHLGVDGHHRETGFRQLLEMPRVGRARQRFNNQPVGPALQCPLQVIFLGGVVVVGIAQEQAIAQITRAGANDLGNSGAVRVGDIVRAEEDIVSAAAHQPAGDSAWGGSRFGR